jgi:outer membrane immunogenic protein
VDHSRGGNKLLLGAVALAALAAHGPARAADMPAKIIKAPALAAPTWSGFYIGIGVGFRSTEATGT